MQNETTSFEKDYFDSNKKVQGTYSSYEEERLRPAFRALVRKVKQEKLSGKVLDIGCAKGFLVDELRLADFQSYGIDVSNYAIQQAPVQVQQWVKVNDFNKDNIPFEAEVFDVIICMGTLEYLSNQQHALQQINMRLAPGGYLFITTLSHVPAGDKLRIYARSKEYWDNEFEQSGFSFCHNLARKIILSYVQKIAQYDVRKYLKEPDGNTLKKLIAKGMFAAGLSGLLLKFLVGKQIKSGYLILGYQKNK